MVPAILVLLLTLPREWWGILSGLVGEIFRTFVESQPLPDTIGQPIWGFEVVKGLPPVPGCSCPVAPYRVDSPGSIPAGGRDNPLHFLRFGDGGCNLSHSLIALSHAAADPVSRPGIELLCGVSPQCQHQASMEGTGVQNRRKGPTAELNCRENCIYFPGWE